MLGVLADLLTIGVGVTISPLAIVAVIIMATSGKGRSNGTAFVLGCYLFTVVFVAALVVIGRASRTEDPKSGPHLIVDILEIVLGAALLVLAVLQWRKRNSVDVPKWMQGLDRLTIAKAFILGILISGPLSPKDIPLLISAGGRISQSPIPPGQIAAVILIFAAIAVTAVSVPWLISVVSPTKVELRLSGTRQWLITNHAVIMVILFLLLGVKLIGAGILDLAGSS
ncbi:GAP family protein [Leifsonia naganoensis]